MQGSASRLSAPEIAARLRARFGEDVLDAADDHGDAVVTVTAARYAEVARMLRDDEALAFDFYDFLSAVDRTPGGGGVEVVLQVGSTRHGHHCRVKVDCGAESPRCPSVAAVWAGADWGERETAELFGVEFEGHPDPRRLLLADQFEGHPMRKSFPLMTREAKPWPGAVEGEDEDEDE